MSEPYWTDHCTHGHDCYVGSFIHYERLEKGERKTKVDIYIYPDDYYGHEVCLRYGEEDSEYMSPTGLAPFMRSAAHDQNGLYAKALEVLLRRGKIKWEKNT
jgi:hypothetical protein